MTTKNAILLIVKQNPGIDYNSLLNKFASSYSNANSARAALSRSLKDLTIYGLISRRNNRYYLMDVGESEIFSEIKNKLVLALNSLMAEKTPVEKIDPIVEKLQILIERAKQDKDLLKTSKGSLDFSISSLESVREELDKKIRHHTYISKVFSDQIDSLKDLGFEDSFSRETTSESIALLETVFSSQPENEFMVESQIVSFTEPAAEKLGLKIRNNSFSLPKTLFNDFSSFLLDHKQELSIRPATIFSSVLKAQIYSDRVFLSGPYPIVAEWKANLKTEKSGLKN